MHSFVRSILHAFIYSLATIVYFNLILVVVVVSPLASSCTEIQHRRKQHTTDTIFTVHVVTVC